MLTSDTTLLRGQPRSPFGSANARITVGPPIARPSAGQCQETTFERPGAAGQSARAPGSRRPRGGAALNSTGQTQPLASPRASAPTAKQPVRAAGIHG